MYAVGTLIIVTVVFAAVFAPILAPHDPTLQNSPKRLLPPVWVAGGDATYPFGTDQLGRDVLSRLLYGARISLAVGVAASIVAAVVGVLLGLTAGFREGPIDTVIMGIVDTQMAFPFILLAIAVMAFLGSSLINVIVVLVISNWVVFARLVRGAVLSVKHSEFVLAARTLGASNIRIVFRHILPQLVAPIIVMTNIQVAQMILAESSLSFLGLGVQPPTPTWGGILSDSRRYMAQSAWLSIFPGLAIVFTVLGVIYLGDLIRVTLDPKYRGR
jgi:ABC-type dipeptide/oligopeptide/nickel transport system permease subunit